MSECPECGFDPETVDRAILAAVVMGEARRWEDLLADLATHDAALRRRPEPDIWSALEDAAHVGDALAVLAQRVARMRAEDDPDLEWWDQDAAAVEGRYNERDPGDVRVAIADGAVALALGLPRPDDPVAWERGGTRRGERFTVEGIARYALHESVHHRLDARLAGS